MDALIFDFDGVLVDSEPVHLEAFAAVLAPEGILLTREEYLQRYLGFDDYTCLAEAFRRHGVSADADRLRVLAEEKTRRLREHLGRSVPPVPGAVELVRSAVREGIPLAVASGALRREIEIGLEAIGLRDCFPVIVAADEVRYTKPHPESYRQAVQKLQEHWGRPLRPERCLAVEDSPTGIASARAAGLRVLALATSYPPEELRQADRVEPDLTAVTLQALRAAAG